MKLSIISTRIIFYLFISIFYSQISYGNPLGSFIAVAGGKIILDFVGGFANKMGASAAEALIQKYPPPSSGKEKLIYEEPDGGYLKYEYVGNRGASQVYRVTSNGGGFCCYSKGEKRCPIPFSLSIGSPCLCDQGEGVICN